jgi:hypothetical protein
VLEQDAALYGPPTQQGTGPVLDVRRSIDFLLTTAGATAGAEVAR